MVTIGVAVGRCGLTRSDAADAVISRTGIKLCLVLYIYACPIFLCHSLTMPKEAIDISCVSSQHAGIKYVLCVLTILCLEQITSIVEFTLINSFRSSLNHTLLGLITFCRVFIRIIFNLYYNIVRMSVANVVLLFQ